MQPRLDPFKIAPAALKPMLDFEAYFARCTLEQPLIHLLKMRVSQLNGCAYCLDMHSKDARAGGETEQRLYLLDAWRETPFYTARERAALAWTEALTQIAQTHAPHEVYDAVRAHFSEQELVDLTSVIVAINGWNRIAIGFRSLPGVYQPGGVARRAVAGRSAQVGGAS